MLKSNFQKDYFHNIPYDCYSFWLTPYRISFPTLCDDDSYDPLLLFLCSLLHLLYSLEEDLSLLLGLENWNIAFHHILSYFPNRYTLKLFVVHGSCHLDGMLYQQKELAQVLCIRNSPLIYFLSQASVLLLQFYIEHCSHILNNILRLFWQPFCNKNQLQAWKIDRSNQYRLSWN